MCMAKLAEVAERYEEVTKYMLRCVRDKSGDELTAEERNLMSVAYKNLIAARRTAFRVTESQIPSQEEAVQPVAEAYKEAISKELQDLIQTVMDDVVSTFTAGPQAATDQECLAFFHKMAGDYNRYGAELTTGETKAQFSEKAKVAYAKALEGCTVQVPQGTNYNRECRARGAEPGPLSDSETEDALLKTNSIRLGLVLNYSVFKYEILNEKVEAAEMAEQAFDAAMSELDSLSEEQYRDSTLIMQLLKDNKDLWSSMLSSWRNNKL